MDDIIEAWLNTYRAARRSPETVRARRSYVTMMANVVDPLALSPDGLNAYLASRSRLAPESFKSMVVSLRSFYEWAYRRGLIECDLASELPSVTVPKGLPSPISSFALRRARALAAGNEETMLALDLGALAGLRRGEICRFHESNVTDLGFVIRGKGGITRLIPIHPRLAERIGRLQGWAFASPIRTGMHAGPDYVVRRLQRVLPPPYTAHSLRHYFATEAYRKTRDIRAVQMLLGHASLETTMRYVLPDVEAMTTAVRSVA